MSLTEDEVRSLLRECVTVVKPGETLVIRGDPDWTPNQMREVQDWLDHEVKWRPLDFKILVVPGEELGVAEATEPAWLKECRKDVFRAEQVEAVRLTHLPTGVVAEGRDRDEAVTRMAQELFSRGKISVNDARAAHGLPPLHPEPSGA
jgi:hypothetical protein